VRWVTGAGKDIGDPHDRLTAEEDWSDRSEDIEADVVRQRRTPGPRHPFSRLRATRPQRGGGISPIFIGLVLATAASGWLLWSETGPAQAAVFVFVLCGWLVSLCLHEFSHAFTALRGGDHTVAEKGYLTLNPVKYGHPVLTVLLPVLFLIGGGIPLPGGAVMIETHRLRNRFRDSLVSFAGPLVNIVCAGVLLTVLSVAGPDAIFSLEEPRAAFWSALTLMAYLQIATAVLNLLPIPGLDGYGVIGPYLSDSARAFARSILPFGMLIVFMVVLLPPVRAALTAATDAILDAADAPINGLYYGFQLFQFWG
jgi:Zn-dependent protease